MWLTQAQGGDQDAYGALLTELTVVVRAYVLSKFGRLENLDDCVQDSLIALHQARHTYDATRPFRPWMFAIVSNRAIDSLRNARRHSRLNGTESVEEITIEEAEPTAAIDTGKLLNALSENLRDALVMTKIHGYSIKECAERQGVSESLVKIRVHRGLRKLQALCELDV